MAARTPGLIADSEARAAVGFRRALTCHQPLAFAPLLNFFERRAVAGIEEVQDGVFRRSVSLPHGPALVEFQDGGDHIICRLYLDDAQDLEVAIGRCRRLLDLDVEPSEIEAVLTRDHRLRPLVARLPGLRVPGAIDPQELAIRAVLGQQVSVAGARTSAARLVAAYGRPLSRPLGAITHLWPRAEVLAESDLRALKVPEVRRQTVRRLARALANGTLRLDAGVARDEVRERLLELSGIGPWTASYVQMRALGDRDAFLATDLGVKQGAAALGLPSEPDALEAYADRWRPWRAYAVQYLWVAAGSGRSR